MFGNSIIFPSFQHLFLILNRERADSFEKPKPGHFDQQLALLIFAGKEKKDSAKELYQLSTRPNPLEQSIAKLVPNWFVFFIHSKGAFYYLQPSSLPHSRRQFRNWQNLHKASSKLNKKIKSLNLERGTKNFRCSPRANFWAQFQKKSEENVGKKSSTTRQ